MKTLIPLSNSLNPLYTDLMLPRIEESIIPQSLNKQLFSFLKENKVMCGVQKIKICKDPEIPLDIDYAVCDGMEISINYDQEKKVLIKANFTKKQEARALANILSENIGCRVRIDYGSQSYDSIDTFEIIKYVSYFIIALIMFLTFSSLKPCNARDFNQYNPNTGQTIYYQQNSAAAVYHKVKVPSDNYERSTPHFSNNLAPALGNLGHHAYSEPTDVDELLPE